MRKLIGLTGPAIIGLASLLGGCSGDDAANDDADASVPDDDAADDDASADDDGADDDATMDDDGADDDVSADDDTTTDDDGADDDATADDDVTDDDATTDDDAADDDAADDDDTIDGGADDDAVEGADSGLEVTYYGDALGIFETRCLGCHQEGGIAPIRLDVYETARENAETIQLYTEARIMPPFLLEHGTGCGEFADAAWLTQEEIDTLGAWVEGGALEGEPRAIEVPPLPSLPDGVEEITTPVFTPEPGGTEVLEHDEYRCFLMDRRTTADYEFLTGYEVLPGNPALIHHVVVFQVDETADSGIDNPNGGVYTNGELMEALDLESPDRDGWPCFAGPGEGVDIKQLPISWGPGTGAVQMPNESGAIMTPADRLVVQVHYNMENEELLGESDETTIRLQVEPIVTNVGFSLIIDPLLESLEGEPQVLEPGNPDVQVSWTRAIADTQVGRFPGLELWGVWPHMHERGRDFQLSGTIGGEDACLAEMTFWDFHWQLAYFYEQGIPVTSEDVLSATCHYDTSEDTEPVLPGWGTDNEMCFTSMYFTAPVLAVLQALED